MNDRPHVLLSCAMSVDGYIDDTGPERLLLSNDEDFDHVDELRAGCDAILVGANTIRRDDPRLLVRSADRVRGRVSRGMTPHPIKVTVTATGTLDPSSAFFTAGEGVKLVYCSSPAEHGLRERLADRATVVDAGDPADLRIVLADLFERGVRRLMVEGGSAVNTQLLTSGLADELELAIAPFFVGDRDAPRFVGAGAFPWTPVRRMRLAAVRRMGDVVLVRYTLTSPESRE